MYSGDSDWATKSNRHFLPWGQCYCTTINTGAAARRKGASISTSSSDDAQTQQRSAHNDSILRTEPRVPTLQLGPRKNDRTQAAYTTFSTTGQLTLSLKELHRVVSYFRHLILPLSRREGYRDRETDALVWPLARTREKGGYSPHTTKETARRLRETTQGVWLWRFCVCARVSCLLWRGFRSPSAGWATLLRVLAGRR